jgi:hypothetical protein
VLEAAHGHLRRIDSKTGRSEDVAFASGVPRELAFLGDYAAMTISLPKAGRLEGLALGDNVARSRALVWSADRRSPARLRR